MSADQLPEPEEATKTFEERTPLATMVSGGIFVAAALYFIVGWILGTFNLEYPIVQWIVAISVVIGSIRIGLSPATQIKINRKTGWVEAEASGVRWKGYANQPERFMVLERVVEGRGSQMITEYKLNLMLSEEDQFDVYLQTKDVKEAIQWIEDAKKALSNVAKSEKIRTT